MANITGTDPDEQIRSQEPDELPLPCANSEINCDANLLLGSWHADMPERSAPQAIELLPTPNIKDTHPKIPTRPRKKDSTEPNEMWLQSRSQDPKVEKSDTSTTSSLSSKDAGSSDCSERSDTIVVVQDIALDSERKSGRIQVSQEIEEGWEISLESLEVLEEVLGEGEFGIVYKGRYSGKDGKTIDVAVKQLKGTQQILTSHDFVLVINSLILTFLHAKHLS